nr:MAG TPA: Putative Fe-S cluster [Caudoviricetes sp.]
MDRSARIGTCELGRPLLVASVGLASCPLSRDRTDGGHDHMRPIIRCSGCGGVTCRELAPRIVVDVSPR